MQHRPTHSNGFSLVEVLVAITLLLIALVGPMTFFARSSQSAEVANDRVIATFLAQEGTELIQKLRDDKVLEAFAQLEQGQNPGNPWGDFIDEVDDCIADKCGTELENDGVVTIRDCADIDNCQLNLVTEGGLRARYTHDSSGEETAYIRWLELSGSGQEMTVVSIVEWRNTALQQPQRVEVRTALFDIYHDLWNN